jgi:hypothetical protein
MDISGKIAYNKKRWSLPPFEGVIKNEKMYRN